MKSNIVMAALAAMGASALREPSQYVFRGYGKFANNGGSRSVKRYPQMVVSSPEEIAEWNRSVCTRQVTRRLARQL